MDSLGKRIRQLRGSRSQSAYAAQLGISKGALGCYERNTSYPDARVLSAICLLEGVSGDWILFGKESIQTAVPAPDDERVNDMERRLGFVEDVLHAVLRARREK